uniref:Undecaprenyl phosphate-alpha-4-amino-4-deoxy-L-arabinose arabinosyl transferase n=1 Tax=Erwinia amylovora ATCC BAA-2158 TaxID=889211 RepID=E5B3E9_ERWAM|nr:4-amino-4-deoxy-L-arabinose transferase [Erwinia amylovora ATCC BAA-2158]
MKYTRYALLLPLFYALFYLIPPELRALWQPDEFRYAEVGREMLVSGNWVVPHFLDLRYFEKPVAGYWVNSLGQWLFGRSHFAVRSGSIFSITLSALLVYWLALRMWQQRSTALLSAVVFLTCLLVYGVGTYAVLDPIITLWMVAAMCSFWLAAQTSSRLQRVTGWLLLGLACGMGLMTKGFLALAVPLVAIVPWMLWQRRYRELLLFGPLAILSAAIISAPWAVSIARQEPDFWHYFFWVEHVQRFAQPDAQHKAPFWYYLPVLLAGTLPWLGLLPGALRRAWRERRTCPASFYLLCWVVMPVLFFSLAKGKLPTYILPCFAPLAILLAHHGVKVAGTEGRALSANGIINLLFGLLGLLAVVLALAPWGVVQHPLYARSELFKVLLAAIAFLWWALTGLVSLADGARYWRLAALSPLALAWVMAAVIPDRIIDSKQPQSFIAAINQKLQHSRYVLGNEVGVASALAWELQRSDILLFSQQGELKYGLSYPDAKGRFIASEDFPNWLKEHRRLGSVSLVMKLSDENSQLDERIPVPDQKYQRGRLRLVYYSWQP